MEFSDLNRRRFLKTSAAAVAVGAGLSADSVSAAALSKAEVMKWQSRVGSQFKVGSAVLQLQAADVTDYSADAARPQDIRPHAISMLFVLHYGRVDAERDRLTCDGQEMYLTQVVAPRDRSGEFFEVVLN